MPFCKVGSKPRPNTTSPNPPQLTSPHLALVAQWAADAWHQHLSRHRLGWLQEVGQTCREEVEVGGEGASTMGFSEGIQEKELAGEVV